MILPDELLELILLELNYQDIVNLQYFDEFIKKYNILEKRKMKGFPRSSGWCEEHWINKTDPINISEENYPSENDLVVTLEFLQDNNTDLVRGDVIYYESQSSCYHNSHAFFDGEKLVELSDVGEFGGLPKLFHVIENNVPIKYWDNCINSQMVYFDYTLVKQQCLNNIKYDELEKDLYGIFTTFTYNNKEYKIVWDYHYEDDINDLTYEIEDVDVRDTLLSKFKNALLGDNLDFSHSSEYDLDDDNILYVCI